MLFFKHKKSHSHKYKSFILHLKSSKLISEIYYQFLTWRHLAGIPDVKSHVISRFIQKPQSFKRIGDSTDRSLKSPVFNRRLPCSCPSVSKCLVKCTVVLSDKVTAKVFIVFQTPQKRKSYIKHGCATLTLHQIVSSLASTS